MVRTFVLGAALVLPGIALACPGKNATAAADTVSTEAVAAKADASACAKKAALVGENCSYTTGMMAQRVMVEGSNWTYSGKMANTKNDLDSRVAAPFAVGPDSDQIHLVANEILEELATSGMQSTRLTLEGRLLEVDGVSYVVLTGYKQITS